MAPATQLARDSSGANFEHKPARLAQPWPPPATSSCRPDQTLRNAHMGAKVRTLRSRLSEVETAGSMGAKFRRGLALECAIAGSCRIGLRTLCARRREITAALPKDCGSSESD